MKRVIGIMSGKGGVGKTTISVNLALAMHRLGEDVMVVDADLRNPSLGLHLGVFDYDLTLHDVLEKDMPLIEALYIHPTGLKFVPSHVSLHYLNIEPSKMLKAFSDVYATTIIDSPPGLGDDALAVMQTCDEAIVVTTPHLPDVAGALRTIEVAKAMGVRIMGIILNSVKGKGYEVTAAELEAVSGVRVLQTIPWDSEIPKSISLKTPVIEHNQVASSSIAFYEMASKITGLNYDKPNLIGLRRFMKTLSKIV
ncbi:MAG: P-loop NTPase [Candidatus Altiarchaeota archaeon]|nr:P-loop NTPase [Candidatus Altiarchaeota archaeon]